MMGVQFTVYGDPQQKGSARGFAVPVPGQRTAKGDQKFRAVVTSANPNLKRWESTIAAEAQLVARSSAFFANDGVGIRLDFVLARPPSVSVKSRPLPTVTPDLDKLVRGAIDPLKGILFRDDAQVVYIKSTKKYATETPPRPHLVVTVWPYTADPED